MIIGDSLNKYLEQVIWFKYQTIQAFTVSKYSASVKFSPKFSLNWGIPHTLSSSFNAFSPEVTPLPLNVAETSSPLIVTKVVELVFSTIATSFCLNTVLTTFSLKNKIGFSLKFGLLQYWVGLSCSSLHNVVFIFFV